MIENIVAAAKLMNHNAQKNIVALDFGREPVLIYGKKVRFGIFSVDENDNLRLVNDGIGANNKKDILTKFDLLCMDAANGVSVA